MGNKFGKVKGCFTGSIIIERPDNPPVYYSGPLDENDGLGHSFCYVRPDNPNEQQTTTSTKTTNTFRTISGASVSANTSTQPLSTSTLDLYYSLEKAASFDCTTSFTSVPLQPVPRTGFGGTTGPSSGPLFMSGPLERTFMSGPIDTVSFQRSFSYAASASYRRPRLLFLRRKVGIIGVLRRVVSRTMYRRSNQNSVVAPIKSGGKTADDWSDKNEMTVNSSSVNLSSEESLNDELGNECEGNNVQWAQGKAGEDRVHVVVSEEHGWVFVGIYDGFNGPDAPDYLLSNLYANVHKELKGLLWDDRVASGEVGAVQAEEDGDMDIGERKSGDEKGGCERYENTESKPVKRSMKYRGVAKKWEENQRRWRSEWDKERLELDRKLKEQLYRSRSSGSGATNHGDVLKALSQALKKTEEAFLEIADSMVMENPELALMGSCVLVMLMKGEDVYVMNVGDSRAVLAQTKEPDCWLEKIGQDLECINEETMNDLEVSDGEKASMTPSLNALQLSVDHSTSMEEEARRIRSEHPDDPNAMVNDRVKGSLKVTRAFGAGYLKQPKWNNALLEVFRINYMGTSPYINCLPSLCHHRLGPKDRFLILSSDGLYQYFTNEEAVSEVELFISLQPEGDPAQHLVEEVLFRAANKAGMDFHELLEIPQGDRRRYHDDVSIIVISLEGRIWRSFV